MEKNNEFIAFTDYAPEGIDLSKLSNKKYVSLDELLSTEAKNFDINDHPEIVEFLKDTFDKNEFPAWMLTNNNGSGQFAFEDLKKKTEK